MVNSRRPTPSTSDAADGACHHIANRCLVQARHRPGQDTSKQVPRMLARMRLFAVINHEPFADPRQFACERARNKQQR
jgi:hypothetical protein